MATIFLQVDDIHAAYVQAINSGATPVDPLQPDGVHFVVADPDGNWVELLNNAEG